MHLFYPIYLLNIAQSQKAGFFVLKEFLAANKNKFGAGQIVFGFSIG